MIKAGFSLAFEEGNVKRLMKNRPSSIDSN